MTHVTSPQDSGFRKFLLIWFGQFISLAGSAMTRFAITIWAYERTQSALVLALVAAFSFAPAVLLSPLAGVLVDRWDRKWVLIASDLAAGVMTVALFALLLTNSLEIWHLYVIGAVSGIADAFQFPAFSAAVTVLVPKQHYARAHGLQSLADSASTIAAPVLAGIVLALAGIEGVLLIDVITFVFAITSLALVVIPKPQISREGAEARGGLWQEMAYGFRYIWARPSLLRMQLMFFLSNLFGRAGLVMVAPLILARTAGDELALGTVQAGLGMGGVVGSLAISLWGGSRRKVHGIFLGMALSGLLGQVLMGLGRAVPVWAIAGFLIFFFIPILNASNQAIWQAKVAPDVQGKVFTVRRLIAQITAPIGMISAGLLTEGVFEPAMMPDGALAPLLGGILGTGAGAGIGLLLVITGLLAALSGISGYLFPVVRDIETLLPDHKN